MVYVTVKQVNNTIGTTGGKHFNIPAADGEMSCSFSAKKEKNAKGLANLFIFSFLGAAIVLQDFYALSATVEYYIYML